MNFLTTDVNFIFSITYPEDTLNKKSEKRWSGLYFNTYNLFIFLKSVSSTFIKKNNDFIENAVDIIISSFNEAMLTLKNKNEESNVQEYYFELEELFDNNIKKNLGQYKSKEIVGHYVKIISGEYDVYTLLIEGKKDELTTKYVDNAGDISKLKMNLFRDFVLADIRIYGTPSHSDLYFNAKTQLEEIAKSNLGLFRDREGNIDYEDIKVVADMISISKGHHSSIFFITNDNELERTINSIKWSNFLVKERGESISIA